MIVNSDHTLLDFIGKAQELYKSKRYIEFTWRTGEKRTTKQNSALHKYLTMLSEAFNEKGLYAYIQIGSMGKPIETRWTETLVKETLWRPLQKALTGEQSTTKLNRSQYSEIYDYLNNYLIENYNLYIPWPEKGWYKNAYQMQKTS